MEENNRKKDPLNVYVLLMLSIATSIDALAVGLSLSFLNVSIALPAINNRRSNFNWHRNENIN